MHGSGFHLFLHYDLQWLAGHLAALRLVNPEA